MSSRVGSDATALPAVVTGTVAWLVALAVTTVLGPIAPPQEGVWWWGVCAVGSLSGAIGIPFLVRRRTRLVAASSQ